MPMLIEDGLAEHGDVINANKTEILSLSEKAEIVRKLFQSGKSASAESLTKTFGIELTDIEQSVNEKV